LPLDALPQPRPRSTLRSFAATLRPRDLARSAGAPHGRRWCRSRRRPPRAQAL